MSDDDSVNKIDIPQHDGMGFSIIDGSDKGVWGNTGSDIPEPELFGFTASEAGREEHPLGRNAPARATDSPSLRTAEALLSMTAVASASPFLMSAQEGNGQYSALESAPARPGDFRSGTVETESTEGEDSFLDMFRDAVWVVRIAASTTRRAAGYSLRSGIRTGTRMVRAAGTSRTLEEFIEQSQEIAFEEMDRIGVNVGQEDTNRRRKKRYAEKSRKSAAELRERGSQLLEMSADVEYDESVHPAYPHILDQLAPDEARILRFLVTEGPQPAVNVRDVGWVPVTSKLVAAGMSMVGTEAGCRYEDRTQAYLNNLKRLGLVWFSDEPVKDVRRYQLVEAQSKIKDAIDSCKRPKVIHRSIHLTPFGVNFCRVCLPVEEISEDASSVYHTPENPTKHRGPEENERESDDQPWHSEVDQSDGLTEGIRNPHRENPWE